MRSLALFLFVLIAVASCGPAPPAEETISDWEGMTATVTAGDADSDGVAIHYHTAGEGPLSRHGPWPGVRLVGLPQPDSYARDTLSGGGDVDTRHRQERQT